MKKKFESNVAVEIPKTKLHEPDLPWKVTSDDITRNIPEDAEYKSFMSGKSSFKTRAMFLFILIAVIFILTAVMVMSAITDNDKIRRDTAKKEQELAAVKTDLEKLAKDKEALTQSSAQLEKKVGDLAAQKELYTGVIESLTKKGDEAEVDKKGTN